MVLLILENIGTQELLLIGIVALIFLGPRKMPEYARKIGKLMADFRSTTSEFKETWQREINFEEEAKAFRIDDDEPPTQAPAGSIIAIPQVEAISAPEVKEIDAAAFKQDRGSDEQEKEQPTPGNSTTIFDPNDKRNWL